MLIDNALADIELFPSGTVDITVPSTVCISDDSSINVRGQVKEYTIIGDRLYTPRNGDITPDWLTGAIDIIINLKLSEILLDLDSMNNNLIQAIKDIQIAQNSYEEYINIEQTIDSVIATKVTQLNARIDTANSNITTIQQAYATEERAAAIAADQIATSLNTPSGSLSSAVTNLQLAISSLDGRTAQSLGMLEDLNYDTAFTLGMQISRVEAAMDTVNGEFKAEIDRLDLALVTESQVRAQAISRVEAAMDTANGVFRSKIERLDLALVTEAQIRAQAITEAKVEVDNKYASTKLNLESIYDASTGAMKAKGSLQVNANGSIAGVVVTAGGGPSIVTFQGDIIRFQRPNGTYSMIYDNAINDFVFDGTITAKAVRGVELVGNNIIVGTSTVAEANNTGHFEYTSGIRFGTSNDLVKWYGPKIAWVTWNPNTGRAIPSGMSKLNAVTYNTVNGDVFFGGTFQAGILSISKQTTTTLGNMEVATGSFTIPSNTTTLVIAASLSVVGSGFGSGLCTSGLGSVAGTINIQRLVGGTWQNIAGNNGVEPFICTQDDPEKYINGDLGVTATTQITVSAGSSVSLRVQATGVTSFPIVLSGLTVEGSRSLSIAVTGN